MEELLNLQNNRSLGTIFDEVNAELEILIIKPRFLIAKETWLREYSDLNIFIQGRWKSIDTYGVAVLCTEQHYVTLIKKLVVKVYTF